MIPNYLHVRHLMFREECGKRYVRLEKQGLNSQLFLFLSLEFYSLGESKQMVRGLEK